MPLNSTFAAGSRRGYAGVGGGAVGPMMDSAITSSFTALGYVEVSTWPNAGSNNPYTMHVSQDGTYLFIADYQWGTGLNRWTMPTKHKLSTIDPAAVLNRANVTAPLMNVMFSPDGTKVMYGGFSGPLYGNTCSTPFDIGTANSQFQIQSNLGSTYGVTVSDNGLHILRPGGGTENNTNNTTSYSLSTAYGGTATTTGASSFDGSGSECYSALFSRQGFRIFTIEENTQRIGIHTLSTAFNASSYTGASSYWSFAGQTSMAGRRCTHACLSADGNLIYVLGQRGPDTTRYVTQVRIGGSAFVAP